MHIAIEVAEFVDAPMRKPMRDLMSHLERVRYDQSRLLYDGSTEQNLYSHIVFNGEKVAHRSGHAEV